MTSATSQPASGARARRTPAVGWNKVPEVTLWFWLIKVLCTSVGESAADYINETLGFGLGNTTLLATGLLVAALVVQFRTRAYVPAAYWTTVVLVSVTGTLATDNLTDGQGVDLAVSSSVFAVLLALVFFTWWKTEGTLSIHAVNTRRREAFYWLVVLVTFALGTAVGDLLTDRLDMSLLSAVGVFAGLLVLVVLAWRAGAGPVLSFWVAYILTRPLGGSSGDYLSGARADGGAGVGTLATSLVFLGVIAGTVAYLTLSGTDRTERNS